MSPIHNICMLRSQMIYCHCLNLALNFVFEELFDNCRNVSEYSVKCLCWFDDYYGTLNMCCSLRQMDQTVKHH